LPETTTAKDIYCRPGEKSKNRIGRRQHSIKIPLKIFCKYFA